MNQKVWAFVIYSICYEAIIWGIFGYAIFIKGFSGWWVLLAIWLSGCQLKPWHFGVMTKEEYQGN